MVKEVHKWKPMSIRALERPKNRWEDDIRNDMKKLKIKNWICCIQDRNKWKSYVEKGKTFKDRSSSAWRRRWWIRRRRRRRKGMSEQTATFSLYNVKRLNFMAELESVYCAVRTESLYKRIRIVFKRLKYRAYESAMFVSHNMSEGGVLCTKYVNNIASTDCSHPFTLTPNHSFIHCKTKVADRHPAVQKSHEGNPTYYYSKYRKRPLGTILKGNKLRPTNQSY